MLSVDAIEQYVSYQGDIDGWLRSGSPGPLREKDFSLLDELLQAAVSFANGLAAKSFDQRTRNWVEESTADKAAEELLRAFQMNRIW